MQILFLNRQNAFQARVELPPQQFPDGCEKDLQLHVGINMYELKDITPKVIVNFRDSLTEYVAKNGRRILTDEFPEFYSTGNIRAYSPEEFQKMFTEIVTREKAPFLEKKAELAKYGIIPETVGANVFMNWIAANYGTEIVDIYRALNSKDDSYPVDYLKRLQEFLKNVPETFTVRDLLQKVDSIRTDYLEDTRIHAPEDFFFTPLRPINDYIQQLSKDEDGMAPQKPLVHDQLRQEKIVLKDNTAFKGAIDSTVDLIQNELDKWEVYFAPFKEYLKNRTFATDVKSGYTLLETFVNDISLQTAEISKLTEELAKLGKDEPGRPFAEARLKTKKEPFTKRIQEFVANWAEYQKQITWLPHTVNYSYRERRYLEKLVHILDSFQNGKANAPIGQIIMDLSRALPDIKKVIEKGSLPDNVEETAETKE